MPPIFEFGSPQQRERWLRPAIEGVKIGALGIAEPGAGSDVSAIRTSVRPNVRGRRIEWVPSRQPAA